MEHFYLFIYFLRRSFTLVTQAGVQWPISAHHNFRLLGSGNSPASASWVAGIIGIRHHAQLIFFVFLVETGFLHVDQNGLDLLTSWSTRLGLPKCWDYRLEPPCPTGYYIYWMASEFFKMVNILERLYVFTDFRINSPKMFIEYVLESNKYPNEYAVWMF